MESCGEPILAGLPVLDPETPVRLLTTVLGRTSRSFGPGGMGMEVYEETDTRLQRTIAIKVLPEHLASDPSVPRGFESRFPALSNHQVTAALRLFASLLPVSPPASRPSNLTSSLYRRSGGDCVHPARRERGMR